MSISSTPDTNRMAEALSRPGIDPRTWKSLAIVTVVHVDPGHGHFVDVTLLPLGQPGTARVGSQYAGNGFGSYFPIAVDDEVVVGLPDGDPMAGMVVLARLWCAADPPPAEAAANPGDVLLVKAAPGATTRVIVSGGGDVVVEARDGGKVLLGAEAADRGVARQGDETKVDLAALQACLDTRYQLRPSPPPLDLGAFVGGVPTAVTTSSDVVRST